MCGCRFDVDRALQCQVICVELVSQGVSVDVECGIDGGVGDGVGVE